MLQATFLNRQALYLRPDPARVIVRPFKPATEPRDLNPTDKTRANHIVERVLALDAKAAASQLADVLENFQGRHRNLLETFELACRRDGRSRSRRTALFPKSSASSSAPTSCTSIRSRRRHCSIRASCRTPISRATPAGSLRFILSLRAVGEGHVSSLTFRAGTIAADGSIAVDPTARLASSARIGHRVSGPIGDEVEVVFKPEQDISERVIFPVTESQSNGIEDARFVEFSDGGRKTYYATYTAYKGTAIRSELIETSDFLSFRMSPLHGAAARNKGMALFPRRIDGKYAMIARQDNENLYLIYSDDLYRWEGGQAILKPQFPWEFVQIGNCGSPIELEEGWLLLTHGVGPVRKYSIGAVLLDKRDPSKVLARSSEPLLRPEPSEREGYVPNVVYTCGAMPHNDQIILPYAVSDTLLQLRDNEDFCADASNVLNPRIRAGACSKETHGSRNKLLRSGIQRRPGRKPESRRSDRLQDGNRRASYGRATGAEQAGRHCLLVHRRSRDG